MDAGAGARYAEGRLPVVRVRVVPEDGLEIGLRHDLVERPRHQPLERVADRVDEVRDDAQRIRLRVVVLVGARTPVDLARDGLVDDGRWTGRLRGRRRG